MKHARLCIQPAMDYYREHLQASIMSVHLKAFKTAKLFDPHFLENALHLLASFITEPVLLNLKTEFPLYVAALEEISCELDLYFFGSNMPITSLPGKKLQPK